MEDSPQRYLPLLAILRNQSTPYKIVQTLVLSLKHTLYNILSLSYNALS